MCLRNCENNNDHGGHQADWRMLLGRVEVLIYSFCTEEPQASLLQATLAPDTNHGGKVGFQEDVG